MYLCCDVKDDCEGECDNVMITNGKHDKFKGKNHKGLPENYLFILDNNTCELMGVHKYKMPQHKPQQ